MTSILSEFYHLVDRKRNRIGISNYPAWFRGNAFRTFELSPSLIRNDVPLNEEINMYDIFLRETAGLIDRSLNSWEVLSVMRHYGCPTRLLDWTDSLHVALFFAVEWPDILHDPTIWILNPFELNDRSLGKRIIISHPSDIGADYGRCLHDNTWPNELPLAMTPQWISPRLRAQRAYFTCHGSRRESLEKAASGCVEKVVIRDEWVAPLKDELRRSRTDYRSLFPGLEGIGMFMQKQFRGHH